MEELTSIIGKATSAIGEQYFHLRIDHGDPVYRERVYCYELYHQMRSIWPEACPFYLNGEIDKAAHPILREFGADFAKPDLLVHTPGYMDGNHAMIEVKSSAASNNGIRKDLEKLSLFVTAVGYQRAIYLIYGYEAEATLGRVQAVAAQLEELAPIELWIHTGPGAAAVQY